MTGTAIEITIDGTPTNGANPWIDALVWGGAWANDPEAGAATGPVRITYAAVQGTDPYEVFSSATMTWSANDLNALSRALTAWEAVANIDFVAGVDDDDTDVWFWKVTSSQADGALGWSEIPGYSEGEPLYLAVNGEDESWTAGGLAIGGYAYITLIHEIGHLLGLAHPHDGGDAVDGNVFPGVTSEFGDLGQFDLNQGIFTTMSYNDGWVSEFPAHQSNGFGWQGTPMALDIAAIQEIYGANMSYKTGNDVYKLPSSNKAGTYWSCIWDAGGTDRITNESSSRDCVINLNAAPLTGQNAGGFVSFADAIKGGFTIANRVVIENATGGSGDDRITGNGAVNRLDGRSGNDTLRGGAGNDQLSGGSGNDRLNGGTGNDVLRGGSGDDRLSGADGQDIFVFHTALGRSNIDRIDDYSVREDTIHLENAVFNGIRDGDLRAAAFARNAAGTARDASDRVIYETDTGKLFFDRDGTGSAQKVHFATLNSNLGLTHDDFFVI